MDPHSPRADGDDLSELERRLSGLRPGSEGLDADAMLFAAGRASVRPGLGRLLWPALAGCLALLSAGLGAGLLSERTERLALAERLRSAQTDSVPPRSAMPEDGDAALPEEIPADSYLAGRRALEQGLDPLPDRPEPQAGPPEELPPATGPVLQVGRRDVGLQP
jgi:hypothetical protein